MEAIRGAAGVPISLKHYDAIIIQLTNKIQPELFARDCHIYQTISDNFLFPNLIDSSLLQLNQLNQAE
jgi:hypothetical protein